MKWNFVAMVVCLHALEETIYWEESDLIAPRTGSMKYPFVTYVDKKELSENIAQYVDKCNYLMMDKIDIWFNDDEFASNFWRNLKIVAGRAHSIHFFLSEKSSDFIGDFPPFPVLFYSRAAFLELHRKYNVLHRPFYKYTESPKDEPQAFYVDYGSAIEKDPVLSHFLLRKTHRSKGDSVIKKKYPCCHWKTLLSSSFGKQNQKYNKCSAICNQRNLKCKVFVKVNIEEYYPGFQLYRIEDNSDC